MYQSAGCIRVQDVSELKMYQSAFCVKSAVCVKRAACILLRVHVLRHPMLNTSGWVSLALFASTRSTLYERLHQMVMCWFLFRTSGLPCPRVRWWSALKASVC